MSIITLILNAPTVAIRGFFGVVTVGTAVSVVGACISVAVVVTVVMKPSLNDTTPLTIVESYLIESNSIVALNRFIVSSETNYYYNATETLLLIVEELNKFLQEGFPDTFVKVVISNFSSEPQTNVRERKKTRRDTLTRELKQNLHKKNIKLLSTSNVHFESENLSRTKTSTLPIFIETVEPIESITNNIIDFTLLPSDETIEPTLPITNDITESTVQTIGETVESTLPTTSKITETTLLTTLTTIILSTGNTSLVTNTSPIITTSKESFDTILPIFSTQSTTSSVSAEKTVLSSTMFTVTSTLMDNLSQTDYISTIDNDNADLLTSTISEIIDELETTQSFVTPEDDISETSTVSKDETLLTISNTISSILSTMTSNKSITEEIQSSLTETSVTDSSDFYKSSSDSLIDPSVTQDIATAEITPVLTTIILLTDNIEETYSTTTVNNLATTLQTTTPTTVYPSSTIFTHKTSTSSESLPSTIPATKTTTTRRTTTIVPSSQSYSSSIQTDEISTLSEFLSNTTSATTLLHNTTSGKCNASAYDYGNRKSVVFVYGTIYFNVTGNKTVSSEEIFLALKIWNAVITLADTCGQPSAAPSTFNPILSTISKPSKTNVSVAVLITENSIPVSVLNETVQITIPPSVFQNATTQIPIATTTATTTTTTTTQAQPFEPTVNFDLAL